jgi:hypothetical protein
MLAYIEPFVYLLQDAERPDRHSFAPRGNEKYSLVSRNPIPQ